MMLTSTGLNFLLFDLKMRPVFVDHEPHSSASQNVLLYGPRLARGQQVVHPWNTLLFVYEYVINIEFQF